MKVISWIGYFSLLLLFPVAVVFTMLLDSHSESFDCDEPLAILVVATATLLVYAVSTVINGVRRRFIIAMLCLAVCVPLGARAIPALIDQWKNGQPDCIYR